MQVHHAVHTFVRCLTKILASCPSLGHTSGQVLYHYMRTMSVCRSVLAEAVFKELVSMSPLNSFVSVDSASIGPAVSKGSHDPRVMWAAQKAGLNLSRRNIRPFDEQVDIVNYDLVLTMDHFDHDEVSRVLSVHCANVAQHEQHEYVYRLRIVSSHGSTFT